MIEALYYIGISQSLFVTLVLLTKRNKQGSDWVLFAWLLTISFKLAILLASTKTNNYFDSQFSIGLIPLTFGPFLYLYTKYLMYRTFFIQSKDYKHFLPFFAFTLLYFLFFKGKLIFDSPLLIERDGYFVARIIYSFSFLASIAYYSFATLYLLKRYQKNISNRFSYYSKEIQLNWVYFLTIFFIVTHTTYVFLGIYNVFIEESFFNIYLISDVCLTILTFSVSYFGIKQPHLFKLPVDVGESNTEEEIDIIEEIDEVVKEKYKQSNLADEVKVSHIEKLYQHMELEKPYLNPELTVQDLSKQLNIPRHHLTEILNNDIGKNFFNFINEYRVNEVKRRLLESKYDHLTIVAIAFESGFNSKSTFNSIFKQYTNMTPTKWRSEALDSNKENN
jgi:AraC-like DNA-binding protein